jgi:hypothetical protein
MVVRGVHSGRTSKPRRLEEGSATEVRLVRQICATVGEMYPTHQRPTVAMRLLLDSRVVDVLMASAPTFVTFSLWQSFFFSGLNNA